MAAQPVALPRVAIRYCTKCKWMLRAAYFAQELLSTFQSAIGEVALVPESETAGVFTVELTYQTPGSEQQEGGAPAEQKDGVGVRRALLWDYKTERKFPETKVLKQLVRDHIQPERDLGHSDRHGKGSARPAGAQSGETSADAGSDAGTTSSGATALADKRAPAEQQSEDGNRCQDCT